MVKNFFEYVKELIPEKGSVFFRLDNHSTRNDISLYQLADLLCGQGNAFAKEATAYSWNVLELWRYVFPTMGIMFSGIDNLEEDRERWCHFSKEAFIGAICIVAIRNGITFDDEVHENIRQLWERKLNNKETEEEKRYFEELEHDCMNFDDVLYTHKHSAKERALPRHIVEERERRRKEEMERRHQTEEWKDMKKKEKEYFEKCEKEREQRRKERERLETERDYLREYYEHN